jgi:hypothetical protein
MPSGLQRNGGRWLLTTGILRPSPLRAKGLVKRRAVRAVWRYVRLDERGRRRHRSAGTHGARIMHGSAFPRCVKRATRVPWSKQSSGRRPPNNHSCDRDRSPRSGALRRMRRSHRSSRRVRDLAQILAALCAVAAMVALAGAMGEVLSVTPPGPVRSAAPRRPANAAAQHGGGGLSRVAVRHWFQDE